MVYIDPIRSKKIDSDDQKRGESLVQKPARPMIQRAFLLFAAAAVYATASAAPNDAVPPTSNTVVQLWPGVAPGSENARQIEKVSTVPFSMVRNVVVPTLTVYLPEAGKATGTGGQLAQAGGGLVCIGSLLSGGMSALNPARRATKRGATMLGHVSQSHKGRQPARKSNPLTVSDSPPPFAAN